MLQTLRLSYPDLMHLYIRHFPSLRHILRSVTLCLPSLFALSHTLHVLSHSYLYVVHLSWVHSLLLRHGSHLCRSYWQHFSCVYFYVFIMFFIILFIYSIDFSIIFSYLYIQYTFWSYVLIYYWFFLLNLMFLYIMSHL